MSTGVCVTAIPYALLTLKVFLKGVDSKDLSKLKEYR